MPLYECIVIARQDLSAQQSESLTNGLKELITEQGGTFSKVEYWGLRQMAYRIRKNRKGHYTLINIDAPAAAIHELERVMRINENILRHLIVHVEQHDEEPSAIMQRRGRDDRRPRPPRPAHQPRPVTTTEETPKGE